MTAARLSTRPRLGATIARTLTVAAVASTSFAIGLVGSSEVGAVGDEDWLTIVNTYRSMSGLNPVVENPTWSSEAYAHSCYMLQNGISHDEIPGKPGYTPGGDVAGNSGNVAVSSSISATARQHIDLWMTGPFHAIGILRENLATSGFGKCSNASTPTWHSGGTLDVIRGLRGSTARTSPVVFPGRDATVPLHRFITEYPSPMTLCGWTGTAGLPLIAMMPNDVTSATATLTGPGGPIPTCVLHKGNTGSDATARAILDGDNAVVVMPRTDLVDGTYSVSVNSNGGNVNWNFSVDRSAPLGGTPPPAPETEAVGDAARFEPVEPFRHVDSRKGLRAVTLGANKITRIKVADSDVVAISGNFVTVNTRAAGYLTAYNCTTKVPTIATVVYGPAEVAPNQAIVPLQNGDLCLYSKATTDIVIDINGFYRPGDGSGFVPGSPIRLLDSRTTRTPLQPGKERVLRVAGVTGGAPNGAEAVSLNVTAVLPSVDGYIQVYPCNASASPKISSVNYVRGDIRGNSVVVPISSAGTICMRSTASTDVTVDFLGHFANSAGYDLRPLNPVRLFDTRKTTTDFNPVTGGKRLAKGSVARIKVAGVRGIPADAKAVAINVSVTGVDGGSYTTAYPCGTRPKTSSVNIMPHQSANTNGAMVKLSGAGELCLFTSENSHVIVDVNGIWN